MRVISGKKQREDLKDAQLLSIYQQLRAHLEHEDSLVNQRLTWLLTSQSFLFAAVAFLFSRLGEMEYIQQLLGVALIAFIATIGILLTRTVRASVVAAYNSIRMLKIVWAEHFGPFQKGGHLSASPSNSLMIYWPFEKIIQIASKSGDLDTKGEKKIADPSSEDGISGGKSQDFDMRVSKDRYLFLTGGGHPNAGRIGATGSVAITNIFLMGWTVLLTASLIGGVWLTACFYICRTS